MLLARISPTNTLCFALTPTQDTHTHISMSVHIPKNNYSLILNTQPFLRLLAQSNLECIMPEQSWEWETVCVPYAQQAVPWPVFAACCKSLKGAPLGRRG